MFEKVTDTDFKFVRDWLRFHLGQDLGVDKSYFVEVALNDIRDHYGFKSLSETIRKLEIAAPLTRRWRFALDTPNPVSEDRKFVQDTFDSLMVGETFFFRRPSTFQDLRTTVLPDLIRKRESQRRLNVWCAACSSGQEPYSLAMLMAEEFPDILSNWDVRILATDVCIRSLIKARQGVYSDWEISRGVGPALASRYFQPSARAGFQEIIEPIKSRIRFRIHNLIEENGNLPESPFDLILLRNVLIYFDPMTKRRILEIMRKDLADDGFLLLGESETLLGLEVPFAISDSVAALCVPVSSIS